MTVIAEQALDVSVEEEVSHSGRSEFPVDAELLDSSDRALIEPGMEELWSSLSSEGRTRLMHRLRSRAERLDRRNRLRIERSEACARYVDLLCSMPRPSEPGYAAALAEMRAAKERYLSFPRAR